MHRMIARRRIRNTLVGIGFISPWILGFLAFLVYPIAYSFYLSFTRYTGFGAPQWIGLGNYRQLLHDQLFWTSLYNTLYYTALAVPLGTIVALVMALAMNQRLREVLLYRTALYLPSILPAFAVSFIFLVLMDPQNGVLNYLLYLLGLPQVNWLGDPRVAKLSIVLMSQLGAGNAALIFLAGLKAIPRTLYEAAELDGAGQWGKFVHITLPMLTPVLLYNLVIGIIGGLQVFTQSYILTGGGPANSTLFYVYYLYNNAFAYSRLGYAAALSWILFVVSAVLSLLVFRSAARWVHYEIY